MHCAAWLLTFHSFWKSFRQLTGCGKDRFSLGVAQQQSIDVCKRQLVDSLLLQVSSHFIFHVLQDAQGDMQQLTMETPVKSKKQASPRKNSTRRRFKRWGSEKSEHGVKRVLDFETPQKSDRDSTQHETESRTSKAGLESNSEDEDVFQGRYKILRKLETKPGAMPSDENIQDSLSRAPSEHEDRDDQEAMESEPGELELDALADLEETRTPAPCQRQALCDAPLSSGQKSQKAKDRFSMVDTKLMDLIPQTLGPCLVRITCCCNTCQLRVL